MLSGQPPFDQPPRQHLLDRLCGEPLFDVIVIGGGATGLGVAVDAAARGFSVVLCEAEDFAKGTSSRATKLLHGGVRYLAQGDFALVHEALRERRLLLANAAHLAQPLAFVVPAYGLRGRLWDIPLYRCGLSLYDLLAGSSRLGATRCVTRRALLTDSPALRADRLIGGVRYWDGQFDDARVAVALARTAIRGGACVLNYCRVSELITTGTAVSVRRVAGVVVEDRETGRLIPVRARCVINATGVWVDAIRKLNDPRAEETVSPSQGVHVVVDREFFPSDQALLVPKTADGRVLFAVPWLGKVILGTTDTPRHDLPLEPRPFAEEIDFILTEASRYLTRVPDYSDIRSAWAGLRPLVRPPGQEASETKRLSREHLILVSSDGLVTITGGKWTTYRAMAEDVLAACFSHGLLPARPAGVTRSLRLVGAPVAGPGLPSLMMPPGLHLYGSEADIVAGLPGTDRHLLPGLTEAMIRFAVRQEYARTVEDVLARRSRWLFLDAQASITVAADVAQIMAEELGPQFPTLEMVEAYRQLADGYSVSAINSDTHR